MKYFLDTEFLEDGKTIELISIGIVAGDGREFYLENSDFNLDSATDWLKENVVPHLNFEKFGFALEFIKRQILFFIDNDPKPEFWGYYANYDWVLFCQLFGKMMDLPKPFPMFINDMKSFQSVLRPDLVFPRQGEQEHNALADARHIKLMHSILFEPLCKS